MIRRWATLVTVAAALTLTAAASGGGGNSISGNCRVGTSNQSGCAVTWTPHYGTIRFVQGYFYIVELLPGGHTYQVSGTKCVNHVFYAVTITQVIPASATNRGYSRDLAMLQSGKC